RLWSERTWRRESAGATAGFACRAGHWCRWLWATMSDLEEASSGPASQEVSRSRPAGWAVVWVLRRAEEQTGRATARGPEALSGSSLRSVGRAPALPSAHLQEEVHWARSAAGQARCCPEDLASHSECRASQAPCAASPAARSEAESCRPAGCSPGPSPRGGY